MGRWIRRTGAAWIAGAILLTGCGSDDSPQPDETTSAAAQAGVNVSCTAYDATGQQCSLLQIIESSPQGQVEFQTTIDLGAPTFDLDAVSTTLDNPDDLSRLVTDMQNPALNVVFDSQAQQTLAGSAFLDDFTRLVELHPAECRLVRLGEVSIPICV